MENEVDWSAKFMSSPSKDIDLTMEKKVECVNTDGACSQAEKTSSEMKWNHGKCTTTYTFSNEKLAFKAKGKAVDQDGWRVDLTLGGEFKPEKEDWKSSAVLNVSAKDLGGAKLGFETTAEYNKKGEITVKPKVNLEIADEINLGVSLKTDTKTMSETFPQLVYKPADRKGMYWARADMTRSLAMFGCDQQPKDNIRHSFEGVYGWKGLDGIQGKCPFAVRAGLEYDLSDSTDMSLSWSWAKFWQYSAEITHKVDKNWTVSCTQSFDSGFKDAKKCSPYHIGFSASYKL